MPLDPTLEWTGAEWVAVLWPDGRQVVVRSVEGNKALNTPSSQLLS